MYHFSSGTSRYLCSDLNRYFPAEVLLFRSPLGHRQLASVSEQIQKLVMLIVNFIFKNKVGRFTCISGEWVRWTPKTCILSNLLKHRFFNNRCFVLTKPFIKILTILIFELSPSFFEHQELLLKFFMVSTVNKPFTED